LRQNSNALFNHPRAIEITDAIVEDVGRLAQRQVKSLSTWQKNPEPAAVAIESSLYTRASGLWPHQKYFVQLAFDAHRNEKGARFVLADQVGLGKTVQLAMTAQLIALVSDKPILIGVPATLMQQWQTEMIDLLDLPSAYWNGKGWVDEAEVYSIRAKRSKFSNARAASASFHKGCCLNARVFLRLSNRVILLR
jgi:SNF2 family DNA or RNA helicase